MQRLFIALGFLLVLSACGGGGGGSSAPTRPHGTVSGTAFDGLIRNGTVNVYAFNGSKGALLGTSTTNSEGKYTVSITAPSQPVLIEIKGGNYSEEATLKTVNLDPNVDFLLAVTQYTSGQAISTSVTYYTTLATGLAQYLIRSGSPVADAIAATNARMSALAGVDIAKVVPVDITSISSARPTLDDPLRYSFATAAISELTKQQSLKAFPSEAPHERHTSIKWAGLGYADIVHDGTLNGKGASGSLSIGSVPVTTEMYRHDTAIAMLVIASSSKNQTSIKASELRSDAERIAKSIDVVFDGAAPPPFLDGTNSGPSITLAFTSPLTGIVNVVPQVALLDGVALDSATLSIGTVDFGAAANPADVKWSIDTTRVADGQYKMKITALDAIGRTTNFETDVTISNGNIVIDQFPVPGTHVRGTFALIFTPRTATGLSITGVSIVTTANGTIQLTENGDGTWRYNLNTTVFGGGNQTITVRADDSSGRNTTIAYELVVDNTAPVVAHTASTEYVAGDVSFDITVTESNLASANYIIGNANPVTLNAGANAVSIPVGTLPDGDHTITIVATDQAGTTTTVTHTLRVDNKDPVIAHNAPANWISGAVNFNVTVTEANLANATYQVGTSSPVALNTGDNAINIAGGSLADGEHQLVITATDRAGNSTTANHLLKIDNTDPVVTSTLDTDWKRGSILVTTTLTETNLASAVVSIDGAQIGTAIVGSTAFSVNTAVYSDGAHTFSVVATDQAGRSTTYTQTLNVDNTPPVITIGFPLAGSTIGGSFSYRASVRELHSGLVNDSEQVFIDGVQIDTAGLVCTPSVGESISCDKPDSTRNHAGGSHTIEISMRDRAGNTASARVLNVTFDNTGPQFSRSQVVTQNAASGIMRYFFFDSGVGVSSGSVDVSSHSRTLNFQSCPDRGSIQIYTHSYRGPTVSDIAGNTTTLPNTTSTFRVESCFGSN